MSCETQLAAVEFSVRVVPGAGAREVPAKLTLVTHTALPDRGVVLLSDATSGGTLLAADAATLRASPVNDCITIGGGSVSFKLRVPSPLVVAHAAEVGWSQPRFSNITITCRVPLRCVVGPCTAHRASGDGGDGCEVRAWRCGASLVGTGGL
jgi:hypothetical protein